MSFRVLSGIATLSVVAGVASAGVRIDTLTREIGTPTKAEHSSALLVQDGAARVESRESGVMIIKDGKIYVIDNARKAYRVMDKETLKGYANQANAAMAKMQEQMKNMSPEQRAQMEKMMGGMMPPGGAPGAEDKYAAKDTGKNETVEGRKCRVWNLTRNGVVYEELCVVPFSSLPGKEDFEAVFKQISEAFEGMASALPNAGKEASIRNSVKGYPVRTRAIRDGKPFAAETVLKSWKEESIPASAFEVPAGYKKMKNPKMPGG